MAAPVKISRAGAELRIEGLSSLKRDLGRIEKEIPREMTKAMREAARPVIGRAAQLAPNLTGRLAGSLRAYGAGRRTSVGISSRLPYGQVIHWGGTTGRGHKPGVGGSGSVKVKAHPFLATAAEQEQDNTLERIAEAIDRLCARHGFK